MSYQGFCAKYGVHYILPAAIVLPMALTAAFRAVQGQPMDQDDYFFSLMGGSAGFNAGAVAHEIANVYLRRIHAGTTEGAAIVKKVQAAAYSVPVLCAFVLNATVQLEPSDPDKPTSGGIRQNEILSPKPAP